MRRICDYRISTFRREFDNKVLDTRLGWAKKGFVVKRGRKGEIMYPNGFMGHLATYFYDSDVRPDPVGAAKVLDKIRKERNARRRELYRTRKDRQHAEEIFRIKCYANQQFRAAEYRGTWRGLMMGSYAIIFDCETTGLNCYSNDMLSLSYQLVEVTNIHRDDCECRILESGEYFFDWPEDERRVTADAICVNGLTRERLAALGTTTKRTALEKFALAMSKAGIAVAHNSDFDIGFIDEAARQEQIEIGWPRVFDTMTEMTNFCGLDWYDGAKKYKWPRLYELAECLDVKYDDISLHFSSADVELTKRCLMKIITGGLAMP